MHSEKTLNINPQSLRLVIFDVDGTLYNQSQLRRFIAKKLLKHYAKRPSKIKELYILYWFRKLREKHAGHCSINLDEEQYRWCADKTNSTTEDVKKVVEKWIYAEPLKYLPQCLYPGITTLFNILRTKGILIGIYSDYPVTEKLNAMCLSADLTVTSTDHQINCFKPNPEGINYICQALSVPKENTVFIGDRYSKDGLCAMNALVPFVLIPKEKTKAIIKINNLVKQLNISWKANLWDNNFA